MVLDGFVDESGWFRSSEGRFRRFLSLFDEFRPSSVSENNFLRHENHFHEHETMRLFTPMISVFKPGARVFTNVVTVLIGSVKVFEPLIA